MERFNIAVEIIEKAGKYLKDEINKCLKLKEMRYDVKLLQDKESEKIIVGGIKKYFPYDSFLCEEEGLDIRNKDNLWIIDPLDGSLNFSRGIPHFSISIGFNSKTEKFGIVYDFLKNEKFIGIEGKGAFLNGKKIKVSKTEKIEDAICAIGFIRGEKEIKIGLEILNDLVQKVKRIRMMGSACLDLCYLACGRIDFTIHLSLNEWDYYAGEIILKEAGGSFEQI
ncbi:MAG: inositol monophosphatase, partial [Candidatus Omnitrophica bacterium]|nr:inositol monophosphatase [Candidatus Omnitrophota bacterium]